METLKEKKERENLDLDTIEALKDAGSNFSKSHYIEHHFVVTNEHNINKISEYLKRKGYEISDINEEIDEDGEHYFFFDACKYCLVESSTIFEESRKMNEIALSFDEFYDGWGTNIVE
jgi:hypothetical protein